MRLFLLFLTFVAVTGATDAQAQAFRGADDLVAWTFAAEPARVAAGAPVRVVLRAQIAEGWKLYAMDSPAGKPITFQFSDLPAGMRLEGTVQQETPKEGYDPNFDANIRYFDGEAAFTATLSTDGLAPGTYEPGGTLDFMVCDPRQCVPRFGKPFAVPVVVTSPAAEVRPDAGPDPEQAVTEPPVDPFDGARESGELSVPGTGPAPTDGDAPAVQEEAAAMPADYEDARRGGIWGFLVLAVGAGLAALLTPCVFPMIPLTVSYFTKHTESRRRSVRMALVYGLAIVVTFTGLGVLMAMLVGASGAQQIAANPWVNLFIGLVFVLFALSLLGLFELRLPNGLLNYMDRQSREQGGLTGVVFMGLTLTLVSFSCTAPFVGGLLAATVHGEWFYPIAGMLAFSATFAMPFILFALFPRALGALPSSGAWLGAVKVTLGFVELAAALKFLSNADLVFGWGLLSRPLAIAVATVIFFLAGLYLLGKLPLAHEPVPDRIGVGRLLASIVFFGTSLYLLPGLLGAPLGSLDAYLPPRQAADVSLLAGLPREAGAEGDDLFAWHEDVETAFAAGEAAGKPVFIDFTGYTCTNCRAMEANVFPEPRIAMRLTEGFVLLRLYTDDAERGAELQRYQLQLTGTTALPTYAIVDPASGRLLRRHSGMASSGAFAAFLDDGAAQYRADLASR